jgi:subtilisin family serine protease
MDQRPRQRLGRVLPVLSLALSLILTLVGAPAPAASAPQAAPPAGRGTAADWVPGRVLVKTGDAGVHLVSRGALRTQSLWNRLGATLNRFRLDRARELGAGSGLYALEGGPDLDVAAAVAALRAGGAVAYAEPDYIRRVALTPNDEHYAEQEWWLTAEQAQAAWDITTGNPELVIAVVDTGVALNHPEFEGRLVPGANFITPNTEPYDDHGHGTHVAGIAAARGNNGQGIAGICWECRIMPIKALNAAGEGSTAAFAEGIRWAADNGARVINISAGADFGTDAEHEAIRYARGKGVVVIAAAGNTPDGNPHYPAGYDEVVAVSASSRRDSVAGFSSYGDYVDVAAPGINILSTFVQGRNPAYQSESGTSMACPMVAGAAALILTVNPNLSPEQMEWLLEQTVDDIGDPGFDHKAGWGRINILRALQQAPAGPRPVEPPTPTPPPAVPDQSSIQGVIRGIEPEHVEVLLLPQNGLPSRTIQPDAVGLYVFNNLTAGRYTVQLAIKQGGYEFPPAQTAELNGAKDSTARIDFSLTATRPTAFDPVPPQPGAPDLTYFPEVQHTLRGPFLRYWQTHGGLPIFGYPLSEEFEEVNAADGRTYLVQYFERNRFEYHPEFAGTANEVLLGLLGVERTQGRNFPPGAPGPIDATHQWFAPVQHNLSGAFLQYWNAHGGLAIFGYPISEPFEEVSATDGRVYLVQYFERNRFELHPEFAGTPAEVLLGLLGVDSLRARGWIP